MCINLAHIVAQVKNERMSAMDEIKLYSPLHIQVDDINHNFHAGQYEKTSEMTRIVMEAESYDTALAVICEYVTPLKRTESHIVEKDKKWGRDAKKLFFLLSKHSAEVHTPHTC